MAWLIANPDGSSNAAIGDKVVTGGGIYEKLADGTSKLIDALPTVGGKTSSYKEVQQIYANILNSVGQGGGQDTKVVDDVIIEDTDWNNDTFTSDTDYDYELNGSSLAVGNIVGYAIVALVGIVVLDRIMK